MKQIHTPQFNAIARSSWIEIKADSFRSSTIFPRFRCFTNLVLTIRARLGAKQQGAWILVLWRRAEGGVSKIAAGNLERVMSQIRFHEGENGVEWFQTS